MRTTPIVVGLLGLLTACGGGGARPDPHPWFEQSAAVEEHPCDEAFTVGLALANMNSGSWLDVVAVQGRRACSGSGIAVPGMVLFGTGDGGLLVAPPVDVPGWNPGPGGNGSNAYDPVAADFDGDAFPDLACRTGTHLYVYRATGIVEGYSSWEQISIRPGPGGGVGSLGDGMVGGDFDGDGDVDLVAIHTDGSLTSMPNDGTGSFDSDRTRVIETITGAVDLATSDLNDDGNLDLVILASDGVIDARVAVLYGDGTGDFVGEQVYELVGDPHDLDLADLDGDGDTDVVAAVKAYDLSANAPSGAFRGRLVVLARIASSPFPSPLTAEYELASTIVLGQNEDARNVLARDFDGDGDTDLVCGSDPGISTFLVRALTCVENLGAGTFEFLGGPSSAARRFRVPGDPLSIVIRAGDFTGDGRPDVAWQGSTSASYAEGVRLLRNRSGK